MSDEIVTLIHEYHDEQGRLHGLGQAARYFGPDRTIYTVIHDQAGNRITEITSKCQEYWVHGLFIGNTKEEVAEFIAYCQLTESEKVALKLAYGGN